MNSKTPNSDRRRMAGNALDIFDLVKSLTGSEYSTLVDELWKSRHTHSKVNDIPKYVKLVQYIHGLERYDDQNTKKHCGYGKDDNAAWRALKCFTIKQILVAIERAKENETDFAQVQKSPHLIEQLIEKRIWSRADKIAMKCIDTATKIERFENLLQLLQLRSQIVIHSYAATEAELHLESIYSYRKVVREQHENIELFKDALHKLRLISRQGVQPKKNDVSQVLDLPFIRKKLLKSKRAEMYFWVINRIGSRLLKDTKGYLSAIENSIKFFWHGKENWSYFEFRNFGIQSLSDLATFSSMFHIFDKASLAIQNLEEVKKTCELSPLETIDLEGRIFMTKMLLARFKLDKEGMKILAKTFMNWHKERPRVISEDLQLRVYKTAALNAFYIGEYANCIKLTHEFRTKKQSVFRPKITSFMWVFVVLVRLAQDEYQLIKTELSALKKYLKNYEHDNEVYNAIFELGSKLNSKGHPPAPELTIKDAGERISYLLARPRYEDLEHIFPFQEWCETIVNRIEILDALAATNKPLTSL